MRNTGILIVLVCASCEVGCESINQDDCGLRTAVGRIVNGRSTSHLVMPWMVHIQVVNREGKGFAKMLCGGSIITSRFVLTAAHCFASRSNVPHWTRVFYNTSKLIDGPSVGIEELKLHPDYSHETLANDIALIRLRSPLELGMNVRTVCLPVEKMALAGKNAVVSGWGTVSEEGKESRELLYFETIIWCYEMCRGGFISEQQAEAFNSSIALCTHTEGKDSCQGDSGGPLTITSEETGRVIQVGIVSFGYGCARRGRPGIYTRVSAYVPWIEEQVHKVDEEENFYGVKMDTRVVKRIPPE